MARRMHLNVGSRLGYVAQIPRAPEDEKLIIGADSDAHGSVCYITEVVSVGILDIAHERVGRASRILKCMLASRILVISEVLAAVRDESARGLQSSAGNGDIMQFAGIVLAILLSFADASKAEQRQVVMDKNQIRVEAILHFHSDGCGVADLAIESVQIRTCAQLSITNKSSSTITAWADLVYTYAHKGELLPRFEGGGMADYLTSDLGLTPKAPGIPPHATRRTILPDCDGVVLKAVIFADGSTLGDPEWVKAMVEARRRVYSDSVLALKELTVAERSGVPIKVVVAQFKLLGRKENEKQVRPMPISSPSTVIAPPAIFGNIAFNLANAEGKPKGAQQQNIDFWQRAMRNLVHRLQTSEPTVGPSNP